MRFNEFNEGIDPSAKAAIKGMRELSGDQYYGLYKTMKDVAGHDGEKQTSPEGDTDHEVSDKPFAYAYTDEEKNMIKGVDPKAKQITSDKSEEVKEGYYDLNDPDLSMNPIDLSANPSFKELVQRYTQLVYQGHASETSPEEDQEYDEIEQYVAQRFGEKGSAHLQKAGEVSYWGRDDGHGSGHIRSSNLGRPNQPGGNFRTTKAGKMHGQDAKVMKAKVADRLGRHPAPTLPEGMSEGEGDLATALSKLSGSWSGWHKEEDMSSPDIDVYEYDDGEGGYYGRGTIEHNLKSGTVKVEYHDSENDADVVGTFKNMGDAMRALRGSGGNHGGQAPNFDRLGQRKQHGPDDLRKTDRTGRKGTLAGGPTNSLKQAIQWNKGKHGPVGKLPESMEEGNLYSMALQRYPQLKQIDRETVINALNGAYEDYLMHYGYEGIGPDEESSMIDHAVKGLNKGVSEAGNNYHANRTGFARPSGQRDDERHDLDAPRPTIYGLKINGKIWKKDGNTVTFFTKERALAAKNSMLNKRPELEITLVQRPQD